jgi:uncharacterized protein (TIGR03435 family)
MDHKCCCEFRAEKGVEMRALAVVSFAIVALAQDHPVAFDVASVKPSPGPRNKKGADFRYGPQGIEAASYPLKGLVIEAYDVRPSRIETRDAHAKDLLSVAYDLIAKAEHPAPKEELRLMLRTLLTERFQLAVHQESKEQPVYRLVLGKGPKLEKSAAEAGNPRYSQGADHIAVSDATLVQFCDRLSTALDRPVVDATGIQGVYNFRLTLDDMPQKGSGLDLTASSLFTDIQRELGLRLVPEKAVLEYLVIDHLEKPTEN